jgi:hypothetical protein
MGLSITGGLVAAAVVTASVIACGGSGGSDDRATPASSASTPRPTGAAAVDACAIVTQADATALFGQPAVRQEGSKIAVPIRTGECLWTWDASAANQLLQFRIWNTERAYSRPEDEFTQSLELGDRGHVRVHPQGGIDIQWVQGGQMIGLSYSKVGSAVPSPSTKTEPMKELARKIAGRL